MKGRAYDPLLGRFLTADPHVTRPLKSQGWNRYSYVENSPLRFTDPTGFATDANYCHGNQDCGSGGNSPQPQTEPTGDVDGTPTVFDSPPGPECVLCGFGPDNLPGDAGP